MSHSNHGRFAILVQLLAGVLGAGWAVAQEPPPKKGPQDDVLWLRGRKPAVGYELVRIDFENGKPVKFESFVSGLLSEEGNRHFARLAGLAVDHEGALLLGDDTNGVLYRISYAARSISR